MTSRASLKLLIPAGLAAVTVPPSEPGLSVFDDDMMLLMRRCNIKNGLEKKEKTTLARDKDSSRGRLFFKCSGWVVSFDAASTLEIRRRRRHLLLAVFGCFDNAVSTQKTSSNERERSCESARSSSPTVRLIKGLLACKKEETRKGKMVTKTMPPMILCAFSTRGPRRSSSKIK